MRAPPWFVPVALLLSGCATYLTYQMPGIPADASQVAVLWVPVNLDPLEVNGHPIGPHLMAVNNRFKIELPPGRHAITVRYAGLAGGPAIEQEQMIRSPPVTVALEAAAGRQYRLAYARPDVDLYVEKTLTNIPVRVEDMTADSALVRRYARGGSHRIVVPPVPEATPASAPPPAPPTPGGSNSAAQLKHWWSRASEAERGDFLKWTVQPAGSNATAP